MARTDPIPRVALISISEQIAESIQRKLDKRFFADEARPLTLGKTLAVWGIKPEALAALVAGTDPPELGDWARSLEHWHHQIRFNTESRAYARSRASLTKPDEVKLAEMGISPKAEMIQGAIEWVEKELQSNPEKHGLQSPYDPLVRLLEIPSRHVKALLLLDELHSDTHLLVIEAQPDNERLRPNAVLSQADFLKGIATHPYATGII
jgi:hypothetical protein